MIAERQFFLQHIHALIKNILPASFEKRLYPAFFTFKIKDFSQGDVNRFSVIFNRKAFKKYPLVFHNLVKHIEHLQSCDWLRDIQDGMDAEHLTKIFLMPGHKYKVHGPAQLLYSDGSIYTVNPSQFYIHKHYRKIACLFNAKQNLLTASVLFNLYPYAM